MWSVDVMRASPTNATCVNEATATPTPKEQAMTFWLGDIVNVGKWGQHQFVRQVKCLETGQEKVYTIRPHRAFRDKRKKSAESGNLTPR